MTFPADKLLGELEAVLRECDDAANARHPEAIRATRTKAMAAMTCARVLESGRAHRDQVAQIITRLGELTRGEANVWNLPPETLLRFLIGDFQATWDSLANNPKEGLGRGNFMFGLQATILLELVYRVCKRNRAALEEFLLALHTREPKYFWRLPAPVAPGRIGDVSVPPVAGVEPQHQLLGAMFDLIRNGQAHQYQQLKVSVTGGMFGIRMSGADYERNLARSVTQDGRDHHLTINKEDGAVILKVRPDVLFCDLRDAIKATGLPERDLGYEHMEHSWANVSVSDLARCFDEMNR